MARLQEEHKEEHLKYLRELIINKFSKPIFNAKDCKILEEEILTTINQRLSVDTIARLFKIKKSESSPSIFTLDTCSVYVGYNSWKNLVENYLEQSELYLNSFLFEMMERPISFENLVVRFNDFFKSIALYETFGKIILYKAQQKDEDFFKRLFEIELLFEYEETYKYAIYNTVHLLSVLCTKYDWIAAIAIKYYANVNYFVEWVVIPERDYYIPLLENYFYYNAKNPTSTLFYHLIMCTYYGEKKDWCLFEGHYSNIVYLSENATEWNNILKMRWYGVQLYYNKHQREKDFQGILFEKISNDKFINNNDSGHRVSSIFILCTYLHNMEEYQTIIQLFEEKTNKKSDILGYWAELNYNQLKVYYAYALYKMNRQSEAKIIFDEIKENRFDLNFKERIFKIYAELKNVLQNS